MRDDKSADHAMYIRIATEMQDYQLLNNDISLSCNYLPSNLSRDKYYALKCVQHFGFLFYNLEIFRVKTVTSVKYSQVSIIIVNNLSSKVLKVLNAALEQILI